MTWADRHIEALERGEVVKFRPKGNSMTPRIRSGELVTVQPCATPRVGDAVLCRVGGRAYLHIVGAVGAGGFRIENIRGDVNGWTRNVYGCVVNVEP